MKKTLIAAKSQQICGIVSEMLAEFDSAPLCFTTGEAVRRENPADYGLIIISTPLEDEFGLDLCARLSSRTDAALIVLAKGEIADEVQKKIRFTNAAVLGRPVSKPTLLRAVRSAKMQPHGKENGKAPAKKPDDEHTVEKAKACLMQYLKLSEEQAHRHIQKQAMDLRTSRREVAEDILKMYGGSLPI